MDTNDSVASAVFGVFGLSILIIVIAFSVFFVWLFWRIFSRTGMNGALGLLCLIPSIGPLICLMLLAFSRWPIEDTLVASGSGYLPPPAYPRVTPPPATPPGSDIMPG